VILAVDVGGSHVKFLVSGMDPSVGASSRGQAGGGNAKRLGELPAKVRLGANSDAFRGAFRLWDPAS
jgi:hypothetical protein